MWYSKRSCRGGPGRSLPAGAGTFIGAGLALLLAGSSARTEASIETDAGGDPARQHASEARGGMADLGTYRDQVTGDGGRRESTEAVGSLCDQPSGNCTTPDPADGLSSTPTMYLAADDFTPAVNGEVTKVCWWGTYFDGAQNCNPGTDHFRIRYYLNVGGLPGPLIAEYSQGADLVVSGPNLTGGMIAGFLPEYEYAASHPPVPVAAGSCYWIEISNNLQSCSWFWEVADGNDQCLQDGSPPDGYDGTDVLEQDLAFCLDVALGDLALCLPGCDQPAENCTTPDNADGLSSTPTVFLAADDFTPADDGEVSRLCWWGSYFDGAGDCNPGTDDFRIRYYLDADGLPGALIAEFSQDVGNLAVSVPILTGDVIAGFLPEYEYEAIHQPVAVDAGTCYWIEISNDLQNCSWFWEVADGNDHCLQDGSPLDGYDSGDVLEQDLAFCLGLALGDLALCPLACPADCANGDGLVNVVDLLLMLGQWGVAGSCDIDGSGEVDTVDLLIMLGAWGPCD